MTDTDESVRSSHHMLRADGGQVAQTDEDDQRVWYLQKIECQNGHQNTVAHKDYWLPSDQSGPWPTGLRQCPTCGHAVSPDDIVEEFEASIVPNPEVPPDER